MIRVTVWVCHLPGVAQAHYEAVHEAISEPMVWAGLGIGAISGPRVRARAGVRDRET